MSRLAVVGYFLLWCLLVGGLLWAYATALFWLAGMFG